ncbi:MAG: ABC transporter permease [Actinomycetota bacterium]|nr:ABC transporter permease [Actinomycetota bacterium]
MSAIADTGILALPEAAAARRPTWQLLRTAVGLWRTRIGLLLVAALVAVAVFGPYLAPHSPTAFVGQPNTQPSNVLFGTDYLGQDVWSRFLSGGGQILAVSAIATILGLVLGVVVGLIAAYSRNFLDDVLMRAMDVILALPQIMLALVAITTLGAKNWLIVLAVGLTTMPRVARVTRGAAQPVVERDFVAAAEALGVARWRILLGEILPNVLSPLMVEASLRLTYSIGLIGALAFLGFSTDPNGANWGTMIHENQLALVSQPWGVVLPIAAIALLTMGTSLVGDGVSRAAIGIDRGRAAE